MFVCVQFSDSCSFSFDTSSSKSSVCRFWAHSMWIVPYWQFRWVCVMPIVKPSAPPKISRKRFRKYNIISVKWYNELAAGWTLSCKQLSMQTPIINKINGNKHHEGSVTWLILYQQNCQLSNGVANMNISEILDLALYIPQNNGQQCLDHKLLKDIEIRYKMH